MPSPTDPVTPISPSGFLPMARASTRTALQRMVRRLLRDSGSSGGARPTQSGLLSRGSDTSMSVTTVPFNWSKGYEGDSAAWEANLTLIRFARTWTVTARSTSQPFNNQIRRPRTRSGQPAACQLPEVSLFGRIRAEQPGVWKRPRAARTALDPRGNPRLVLRFTGR